MPRTHLTLQERSCIFHQEHASFTNAEVGRRIGRHRATIGRELTRFKAHPSWPYCQQFFPEGGQELRPGVVMRKITGGSRSKPAAAWAQLASLLRTADQQGLDVYEAIKKLIPDYWNTGRRITISAGGPKGLV